MAIYVDTNTLAGSSELDRVAVKIVARQTKHVIRIPELVLDEKRLPALRASRGFLAALLA